MIDIAAWTLVTAALIGSAVALAGTIGDVRTNSTGRSGEAETLPLTAIGLVLSLTAITALALLWLSTDL